MNKCGCAPRELWKLQTGEEVCLCDPRHPWPGRGLIEAPQEPFVFSDADDSEKDCPSPNHATYMRENGECGFCADITDIHYPDADERELAAEREAEAGSPAAQAILGRHLNIIGAAMAADPGVASATPFPDTPAFHQLLQDMIAGDVSFRDGLLRAYEAGRADAKRPA